MSTENDVEVFLESMECQLEELEVPKKEWCHTLTTKLSPEVHQLVQEQIADVNNDFGAIRDALLGCVGLNTIKSTTLAFQKLDPIFNTSAPRNTINKIARWAKKIFKNVTSTEDAFTLFTTAKTHSELDRSV